MQLLPSFVYLTSSRLFGSAVVAANTLEAVADLSTRNAFTAAGAALAVDTDGQVDLALSGYAKLAGIALALTGSTPITLDLTALAAATGVQVAGASAFSTWSKILFQNAGTTSLAISPGGSNPLATPLGGTNPTHTLAAGDDVMWNSSAGKTVDSTHKTVTITPTSGGTMFIAIGGS